MVLIAAGVLEIPIPVTPGIPLIVAGAAMPKVAPIVKIIFGAQ